MSTPWQRTLPAALLAGTAGLASAAMAGAPEPPAATAATFAPPAGRPMLLSRTLTRELADGKAIVATRRYRIAFQRTAGGWLVEGALVASEIEAPPVLAQLAELERNRPDDGLFPLELDAAGMIVPRALAAGPPQQGAASVSQAIAHVVERLQARQRETGVAPDSARFVQEIQALAAGAATSRWPPELFRPDGAETREERHYALPGGGEGVVTIELASQPGENAATMAECTRRVVTEFAGSRRVSREQWTLAPLEQVAAQTAR